MSKPLFTDADVARAERIREARERVGLNQSELGRAMRPKLSPQAVQKWEKGGGITGKYQEQLAKVLRVTPEFLMFGKVNNSDEPSRNDHVGSDRPVRLTGSIVATALAAIAWRLKLVGLTYDLKDAPDVLAQALNWAIDESEENRSALESSLMAYIRQGEQRERTENRPPALEPADGGTRTTRRSGRRK